jgi:hypothetical protein
LEEENKTLRLEINDLKANLKINKEIISGFFNINYNKDKSKFLLEKISNENKRLSLQLEQSTKDIDILRSKVIKLN